MAVVLKRPEAGRDLTEHFVFLAENASLDVARRFLRFTNATFIQLARIPDIGSPCLFPKSRFADVRRWPVHGFERYLIFYRPFENGVEVLRVLHGSRDLPRLFL